MPGFPSKHPPATPADAADVKAALAPRMTITAPLEPCPAPAAAAKTSRGAISLIKAADSRILQLEADVRRREGELAELSGRLGQAQVGHRVW